MEMEKKISGCQGLRINERERVDMAIYTIKGDVTVLHLDYGGGHRKLHM